MMKNIMNDAELEKNLRDFLEMGRLYFEEERGLKFLESVIRYLYQGSDEKLQNTMVKSIKAISEKGGDIVMTIAKSLEKKGEKNGKYHTARKMAQKGMDIELISELTELSIEELKKVLDQ